ncbi:hypothetical protein ACN47E_000421 [Coniothyrium glycines]
MSPYVHVSHTHTHTRTPEHNHTTHSIVPLARHRSTPSRRVVLTNDTDEDDDGADDYPYSAHHRRASRALTLRNQPSELERWNIWSAPRPDDNGEARRRRSSSHAVSTHHFHHARHHSLSDDNDNDNDNDDAEHAFRLRIQAAFQRSTSTHAPRQRHHRDSEISEPALRRQEHWVDEERAAREGRRIRRHGILTAGPTEEEDSECVALYRRGKRTRTGEVYRPLSGWRRERIVYGE